VRAWVWLYVRGLPAAVRTERMREVTSDAYEHLSDPEAGGAWGLVARCARGAPADVVWRLEAGMNTGGAGMVGVLTSPLSYVRYVLFMGVAALALPVGIGLGVAGFTMAVVAVVVPAAFIAAPVLYRFDALNMGSWVVDTLPEALVLMVAGLALFAVELVVVNALMGRLRGVFSLRVGGLRLGR
jgi:hypothetical protein